MTVNTNKAARGEKHTRCVELWKQLGTNPSQEEFSSAYAKRFPNDTVPSPVTITNAFKEAHPGIDKRKKVDGLSAPASVANNLANDSEYHPTTEDIQTVILTARKLGGTANLMKALQEATRLEEMFSTK